MTESPDTNREALAVFEQLLAEPAALRAAVLNAQDLSPEVRRKVHAMLAADDATNGVLERDAAAQLSKLSPETQLSALPERIGPYRILERIGQGGMAAVYRGERADNAFEQTVAIKLILPSRRSEHWETRFLQERQILASLQHPNIAALLDGGLTEHGEPYFAMEFVDGVAITAYCDEKRLSVKQRIALFLAVCDGVNYAHRSLVVHRDLKPDNILVDANGVPKLLDFGIARLLSEATADERTRTVMRALTPEYAAPEQFAGGNVTTAVDVYALGGLLYKLLTGRTPVADVTGSALDIERSIRERGAQPFSKLLAALDRAAVGEISAARSATPARLRRVLNSDLENIALKALRTEPERRYTTVDALAADLERYLNGLPVQARSDTAWYRLRKFAQRHPLGVPLSALAIGGLLLSTGVALKQSNDARAAAERAQLAAARANETRDFVTSLFEFSNPDSNLGERLTARQILDLGANRVNEELVGQPTVRAEMLLLLANTYGQLGLYDAADPLAKQADDIVAQLPAQTLQREAKLTRARLARLGGDYDTAARHLAAASRDVGQAEAAQQAALFIERGELNREQAQFDQAESAFAQALALDRDRRAPPEDIARDLYRIGTLKFDIGDGVAALDLLEEAGRLLRGADAANGTQYAAIQHDIGVMLIQQGDLDRARDKLEDARRMRAKLLGNTHPDFAVTLKELAGIARQQGDTDTAERLYLDALTINETMLGSEHPETSNNLNSLAVFYLGAGRTELALGYALRALVGATAVYGSAHPTVGLMRVNVGSLQRMNGDLESAYESAATGLSTLRAALGDAHQLTGVGYNGLAGVQQAQTAFAEAEVNYRKALAIFESTASGQHPHTVAILNGLGTLLLRIDRNSEAASHFERAIAIGTAVLPADHPNLATVRLGLGHVMSVRGECEQAEALRSIALPVLDAAGHAQRDDILRSIEAIDRCQ